MTKEDTPLPLLSDEQINRMSGDPIAAQAVSSYEFGKVIGMGRGLAAGRNFYEPHILSRDAKIKSLENEVARLQGATNFETVPKEAYDSLEGLAQELREENMRLRKRIGPLPEERLEATGPVKTTPPTN